MNFGQALEVLKEGKKVARNGWNRKGMWLKLIPANMTNVSPVLELQPHQNILPWICMKTADDNFVPWLASQTDILAEDWEIVE